MSYGPANPVLPFLATTEVYPEDESQLRIKQTSIYSNIANNVNIREIAIYDTQQLITGQKFFNPADVRNLRTTFRQVYQIGAIAAGAHQTIAHGIAGLVMFTRMYGTVITDVVDYRPIPYADEGVATNQISLTADATNVYVYVGTTSPDVTSGMVVLEYILG